MSDGIRQALISSLFPQGSSEKLIIHVKTFKDLQSFENKDFRGTPRYLCLTQKKNAIRLSKVKRNQNGTFNIGKTWSLDDIKQIQDVDQQQQQQQQQQQKQQQSTPPQPLKPMVPKHQPSIPRASPTPSPQSCKPYLSPSYNHHTESFQRDERKERDRAREVKRERERQEKKVQEEKERQKKAEEIQAKMAEQASLMNVEELLTDSNWKASGNAAALEKRLLGELHALEAANVHAIIQSDERVRSIVEHIDRSLEELDNMESWLSLYGAELNSMGDDIREIETQNRALQILNSNQHALMAELDNLLTAISIPKRCLDSLQNDPMDKVDDVIRIQESAEILQKVIKTKLDDGLQDMAAVQQRLETYNLHGNRFSERIFKFLKDQFEQQARIYFEQQKTKTGNRKNVAQPHEQIENQLIKYQGFNLWEKEMEPRMYNELQRCYAQAMAPLYERDIRELIDMTRSFYAALRKRDVDELEYIFKPEESRQARALAYAPNLRGDDSKPHRYRHMLRGSVEGVMGGSFSMSSGSGRSSIDEDEKAADDAFTQMISQAIMLVCREQNYMSDLFELTLNAPKSFLERGVVYSQVPNKSDLYSRRDKIRDVKVSKKILTWMEIIFETLEPNLVGLLEYGVKSDPTQAVSMLGAVEFQQEKWDESDQEFVLRLCKSILQRLTKMFENFITEQVRVIEETKVSSKKRRGILSFFRTFPVFAMRLEMAASNVQPESETRVTVNNAYEKIIKAMMGSLDSIAREGDQTGDDKEQLNATIMYIENMHHMYHTLRTNKLHVLEKWIKHAKAQYDNSLNAYIKVIIRRPLGKLLEFFEGVEQMTHTNTPEEVSFHMNFNKTQLRKVIMMFPPREIKKSLEHLYKRVDKHFSEEEGLLQVVWRGIQEEFIRQHERMEDLIRQCYPDAGVKLEFTIQDLLGMMSELARKVNV
ncbi:MAG: exocyst complex component Sec3-domain-containing protein [Benjaminiella poitrasii]|nr:MAG: exocyst complex component Sec3-domain-containing protein [Benjaminiella poitrasii]